MLVLCKCIKVTNTGEGEELLKTEGSVGSGTIRC